MSWFKVDDKLHSSRKLLRIPRRYRLSALGLWTIAGSWSADQETDGKVPDYMIEEWGGNKNLVDWLVKVDLWQEIDEGTEFKNWDEYQPTKAENEAAREKNREKLRTWRERNRVTKPGVTGLQDGSKPDGNPAPVPSRPDPTNTSSKEDVPAPRQKPERPLPANWEPNEAHANYARDRNLDLDAEALTFRDHAAAHDRRARDWNAAFRMWLTKAKPQPAAGPSPWSADYHRDRRPRE